MGRLEALSALSRELVDLWIQATRCYPCEVSTYQNALASTTCCSAEECSYVNMRSSMRCLSDDQACLARRLRRIVSAGRA